MHQKINKNKPAFWGGRKFILFLLLFSLLGFHNCKNETKCSIQSLIAPLEIIEQQYYAFQIYPDDIEQMTRIYPIISDYLRSELSETQWLNISCFYTANNINMDNYLTETLVDMAITLKGQKARVASMSDENLLDLFVNSSSWINCLSMKRKKMMELYAKFNPWDTVRIAGYNSGLEGDKIAGCLECPNILWKFDEKKDLKLTGVVLSKYLSNKGDSAFLMVHMLNKNREDIVFGPARTLGKDTLEFYLGYGCLFW